MLFNMWRLEISDRHTENMQIKVNLHLREVDHMEKQTMYFAIVKENGILTKAGRSIVIQPKPRFKSGSIRWFDDSKLLKTNKEK